MHRWLISLLLLTLAFGAQAGEASQPGNTPPKPQQCEPRSQNADWLAAVNRLRTAPQAGEIINGGVTANVSGIVQLSDAEKAKFAALQDAYTAALIAQTAKWEEQLKALRAEYDAKIAAAMPENKREPVAKLLELSHNSWSSEFDLEAQLTREFVERMKNLPQAAPDEQRAVRQGNIAWLGQQRAQRRQAQESIVSKLKALLTSEESARLDLFDRYRAVPQPDATKK